MNKVILIGNLGKDPEIKNFQDGGKIASFSMATQKRWKTPQGEKQERTDWHNVVSKQNGLSGLIEQYLKKGDKVAITGELITRSYEKDGQTRYVTEVVINEIEFVSTKGEKTEQPAQPAKKKENASSVPHEEKTFTNQIDDDLPF